jgi:hypothetical protein
VVNDHLEAIRRVLRESIWAEARRYPIPLTPPQIAALEVLQNATEEERSAILDGLAVLRRLLPGSAPSP